MKKSSLVFSLLLVSITSILVSCHHEIEERIAIQSDPPLKFHPNGRIRLSQEMTKRERAWLLSQPISITDPEILAELQFLRDEGEISAELYELAIRHYTNQIDGYGLGYDDFSDAIVLRTDVADRMKKKTSLNPIVLKHRINMPYYSGGTILLRIVDDTTPNAPAESRLTQDWKDAVEQAVAEWNALNTGIQFSLSCATDYIIEQGSVLVFMSNYLIDNDRYAEAQFPGHDRPFGLFIRLNRGYNPSPINSAKKFIIAHELGLSLVFGIRILMRVSRRIFPIRDEIDILIFSQCFVQRSLILKHGQDFLSVIACWRRIFSKVVIDRRDLIIVLWSLFLNNCSCIIVLSCYLCFQLYW